MRAVLGGQWVGSRSKDVILVRKSGAEKKGWLVGGGVVVTGCDDNEIWLEGKGNKEEEDEREGGKKEEGRSGGYSWGIRGCCDRRPTQLPHR